MLFRLDMILQQIESEGELSAGVRVGWQGLGDHRGTSAVVNDNVADVGVGPAKRPAVRKFEVLDHIKEKQASRIVSRIRIVVPKLGSTKNSFHGVH